MGSRNNYHLLFTRAFLTSFNAELQNRRDNLTLSKAQISKFSNAVRNNIVDVAILPHSHKNIADKYDMREDTYEVLVNRHYAIFYRINEDKHIIVIGSLFNNRQMKLSFTGKY